MMRFAVVIMVTVVALVACEKSKSQSQQAVTAITACPEGAVLSGAAPPEGLKQQCQKSEGIKHGASRDWWDNKNERTYTEWWNGNPHGVFKHWYKDGKLKREGAHVHGVPAGTWRHYAEDGKVDEQKFATQPPPADWLAQAVAGHPPKDAPPEEPLAVPGRGSAADGAGGAGW